MSASRNRNTVRIIPEQLSLPKLKPFFFRLNQKLILQTIGEENETFLRHQQQQQQTYMITSQLHNNGNQMPPIIGTIIGMTIIMVIPRDEIAKDLGLKAP
jgi:hypothetical protein